MGPIEISLAFLGIFAGLLATVGIAGASVTPPDYRLARVCLWIAAILLGGAILLWGVTTTQPVLVRSLIIGLVGAAIFLGLNEALRWVAIREGMVVEGPEVAQGKQGKFLEATTGGTISARRLNLPEDMTDLPFKTFALATTGGTINMDDLTITRQPGPTIPFPPPTGEFSALANDALRGRAKALAAELREFQQQSDEGYARLGTDSDTRKAFLKARAEEYKTRFSRVTLSMASEFMARLKHVTPPNFSVLTGGNSVLNGGFDGNKPAEDIANFMDFLAQRLAEKN